MSKFNFIEEYIKYYKERESPEVFWRWSAIGCLAAVMRDNMYLKIHNELFYPNMFIVFIADSGEFRKAVPCKAASKFIRTTGNTKLIGGRLSMQQFVRELGQDFTNDDGKMVRGASGVLYSEELTALLVKDPATVPILIEIYDYHDEWTNALVSTGKFKLKDTCVSLIAASNSSMFSKIDTSSDDGLLGRLFIIKPTDKRPRKSLFDLAVTNTLHDDTTLTKHLQKLAKLKGSVAATRAAIDHYNEWYYNIPEEVFMDKVGYGPRLGTHVFKVALCVAAAREDFDKTIEKEDINKSIDLCISLRKNYRAIALTSGLSSHSNKVAIVTKVMLQQPDYKITRAKLIQQTLGDIEGEILDAILIYMDQAELVRECGVKGSPGYMLTKKYVDMLLNDGE